MDVCSVKCQLKSFLEKSKLKDRHHSCHAEFFRRGVTYLVPEKTSGELEKRHVSRGKRRILPCSCLNTNKLIN